VCVCVADIAIDWSDHGLWWPDKNIWLARTRSTLDQYGVQADAKLCFTPMHKNLRIVLPDLQVLDMPVNFSTNVFTNVVRICRELGTSKAVVTRTDFSVRDVVQVSPPPGRENRTRQTTRPISEVLMGVSTPVNHPS